MNSFPSEAQAPSHRKCLLPSVAQTLSVTQVTPAKKITFFKQGDPQFPGVRLAVHQRTFKSFSALMDELSQRLPLSFGVRSVTTPRGLHHLHTLEQLQDGGCYLCSDKMPPKTLSGPGWQQGRGHSALQLGDVEGRLEVPGTSSSWRGPKVPRRIMLIKNRDPRFQRTVVLGHGNTRNLTDFLSKASDVLHFPVKQLYTIHGEKVDSLQGLLRSPSVLVCAGHESFRLPAMEDTRRNGAEALSELTSRNKNGSWGLKAKQSVIHSRSKSGNGPRRVSSPSERSGLSDPPESPHHTWMGSDTNWHLQDTSARLGPLVTGDDIEKKVHVNKDGSLSVEMKVRFHLLNQDPRLWSGRATAAGGGGPVLRKGDSLCGPWEGSSWGFSNAGALGLRPRESGCEEVFYQGQRPGSRYEIWTNPLHTAQGEGMASQRRCRLTLHSCSRGCENRRVTRRTRASDRPPEDSEQDFSYFPRTPESSMGSCSLHKASVAASERWRGQEAGSMLCAGEGTNGGPNPCPKGAEVGDRAQQAKELGSEEEPSLGCMIPGTGGLEGALSDSAKNARSHESCRERAEQCWGCASQMGAVTSQQELSREGGTSSPTLSPLSLRNEDLQVEESMQGTGSTKARLPKAQGHSDSWKAEGCPSPLPPWASAQSGKRRQRSQASTESLPSMSGFGRVSQRNHQRQQHHRRDTPCPLDSLPTKQALSPTKRGRACSDGPAPRCLESSLSPREGASKDSGSPSCASLHSQYPAGVSSAAITPVSNSDLQKSDCASDSYHPNSTSAENEGDPELRVSSPAPIASDTSDSYSSQARADHLDEEAVGSIKSSSPLVLPGAHRGSCCSQVGTSLVCTDGSKAPALPTLVSEGCSVHSRYCPAPTRGQSCVKKQSNYNSSSSTSNRGAAWGLGGARQGEEQLSVPHAPSPGSKSGATRTVRATRRSSPRPRRMLQGKEAGEGESLEQEGDGSLMPTALPHTSPETVVCEWLSNIPEEPILIKYEMGDETTNGVEDGPEGAKEDPAGKHSLEVLRELAQATEQPLEGEISEKPRHDGTLVTDDACPKSGEGLHQRGALGGVSEAPEEARAGEKTRCGGSQGVLPSRISASIQIMKALTSSKQGRPSSLPEVPTAVGRRLSHSACALITCLARLHFFDEDFGSTASKIRFTDSARYQELLSTLQVLWPGCDLGKEELDLGFQELKSGQALPSIKSHAVNEDFTPMSSSGVDVSSGSGGSGESSMPCAVDSTLTPERMELPLKTVASIISYKNPDSRSSENPEDLKSQHLSCPKSSSNFQVLSCITSKDETGENSREQILGSNLEQSVENMMQEEGMKLEKIKEEVEREAVQEERIKEEPLPEVERINEQELPVDHTQAGKGTQEDKRKQKEETARGPGSVDQCFPGMGDKPVEPSSSPSESGGSNASESQCGPKVELPREVVMGDGQTQVCSSEEPKEKSISMACRASLDPDPSWVFKLLKKMEKAFMSDFASALAEFRARWSLQDNHLLDQMVAELEQDMGRRLQDSMEKELWKLQSKTEEKVPRPPRGPFPWEMALQTEHRRHCLQSLHKLSAFTEQTWDLEEELVPAGILGTEPGGTVAAGEEFCPCEACVRKKMGPTSPMDTTGAASAPLRKAFDLQQILQKRKGGDSSGEAVEVTPKKGGTEPLLGQPSTEARLSRDEEAPEPGEAEQNSYQKGEEVIAAQKKEGKTEGGVGRDGEEAERKEQGVTQEEESKAKGSQEKDNLEGGASGGGDRSPGGEGNCAEAQKAKGEGQRKPERGHHRSEKEGSLQDSLGEGQLGRASENSSPDPEGKLLPLMGSGKDTSHQRSGPQTGIAPSSSLSLGIYSQVSQKGSEGIGHSNADIGNTEDEPEGVIHPERKVTGMFPESSMAEQEGAPLSPGTPDQGTDGGPDLADKQVVKSLTFTEVVARTDEFDQDDLDF
ncbi:retinitis pigmentosa 1-like 1 protein [Tamandua tetradactyla]|uniref:retinitis pigmentosa 1-like 1 protein n=1 Tax=Tamandua tetradactyla TaxID=48850 RepID=UPI004053BB20